jgi:hypothetical protein
MKDCTAIIKMHGRIELFMDTFALEFKIPTYSNLVKKIGIYTYKHLFPIECLKYDVNSH